MNLLKFSKPGTIDDIQQKTILAINTWAFGNEAIAQIPFIEEGDDDGEQGIVLIDSFEIPDSSWGYVWLQRQFRLLHSPSGIESRWINGRVKPQEVVKIN